MSPWVKARGGWTPRPLSPRASLSLNVKLTPSFSFPHSSSSDFGRVEKVQGVCYGHHRACARAARRRLPWQAPAGAGEGKRVRGSPRQRSSSPPVGRRDT